MLIWNTRVLLPGFEISRFTFWSKPEIQLLFSRFFIFKSGPGFQIWVSNLRFTSYFNFNFDLFLSNYWLLVFSVLQGSAVKPRVWTFFSVNFAQQPRIKVFNSQFLTQTDISFSRFSNFKVQNGHSRFTLKYPLTKIGDLKNKCAINSNIDCVSFKFSTIQCALNRKIIVAGSLKDMGFLASQIHGGGLRQPILENTV